MFEADSDCKMFEGINLNYTHCPALVKVENPATPLGQCYPSQCGNPRVRGIETTFTRGRACKLVLSSPASLLRRFPWSH